MEDTEEDSDEETDVDLSFYSDADNYKVSESTV